jgi:hypothetical protein
MYGMPLFSRASISSGEHSSYSPIFPTFFNQGRAVLRIQEKFPVEAADTKHLDVVFIGTSYWFIGKKRGKSSTQ